MTFLLVQFVITSGGDSMDVRINIVPLPSGAVSFCGRWHGGLLCGTTLPGKDSPLVVSKLFSDIGIALSMLPMDSDLGSGKMLSLY